jgi:hypothetical protein
MFLEIQYMLEECLSFVPLRLRYGIIQVALSPVHFFAMNLMQQ